MVHLSVRFKRFYVLFSNLYEINKSNLRQKGKTSPIESALDPFLSEIQETLDFFLSFKKKFLIIAKKIEVKLY